MKKIQWLLNDTDRTSNWWLNKSWLIYWIMTCTYNYRFPIATIVCYVPVKPPWLTSMATHRYPQRLSLRWWWPNPLLNYQKWPELCMNTNSLMRFVLLEISWNSFFLILTKMFKNYPRVDACSINDTFLRLLRLPEVWLAQQKAMKWSRTTHGMTLILASFGGMIVRKCKDTWIVTMTKK